MANTHIIFQPLKMASQDVVSFDRTIVGATDFDNGAFLIETTPATTIFGKNDLNVYTATAPTTAGLALERLLVVDSSEVARIDGTFKINLLDPRYNYVPAGVTAKARQLVQGDEFLISATAFSSTPTVGQFAIPQNGDTRLAPSATQTGAKVIVKIIDNYTFSVGKQSVAGFRCLVVAA